MANWLLALIALARWMSNSPSPTDKKRDIAAPFIPDWRFGRWRPGVVAALLNMLPKPRKPAG